MLPEHTALLEKLDSLCRTAEKARQALLTSRHSLPDIQKEMCHYQLGWSDLSLLSAKMAEVEKAAGEWEKAVLDTEQQG